MSPSMAHSVDRPSSGLHSVHLSSSGDTDAQQKQQHGQHDQRTRRSRSDNLPRTAAFTTTFTSDISLVLVCTLASISFSALVLHGTSRLVSPFDSSHLVGRSSQSAVAHSSSSSSVSPPSPLSSFSLPGLRWDAIHFLSLASRGYEYEQQVAFQPGWAAVLYGAGYALAHVRRHGQVTEDDILQAAVVVNVTARLLANVSLYCLTRTLGSRRTALVTAILYAIQPAPAVLLAPYTEPLFAAASFLATYCAVTYRYWLAAALFAIATSLRATGVFSSLIIAWQVILCDRRDDERRSILGWLRRLFFAACLSGMICAPFLGFQIYNYTSFCLNSTTIRPWCQAAVPVSYSWVQREYWNVGLFRYWSVEQLPNFILAAPILVTTLPGSVKFLRRRLMNDAPFSSSLGADLRVALHLHHLLMMSLLLFTSHTQIVLRVASTDPVVWWNIATAVLGPEPEPLQQSLQGHQRQSLGQEDTRAHTQTYPPFRMGRVGRAWIGWAVIWGGVSLTLWSGHYPPA